MEKRCWPWGRMVAGTVAGIILCFAVSFFVASVESRQGADAAKTAEPCRLQVDLSKPGDYSGKFCQTFVNAHCNYLQILVEPPLASADDAVAIVKGLRGNYSIVASNGNAVEKRNFESSDIHGIPLADRDHWVPAIDFGNLPKGDYTIIFVIEEGAPQLSGIPQVIVGHYALCGMEYVISTVEGWLGIGCSIVAGIIILVIVIASWIDRPPMTL